MPDNLEDIFPDNRSKSMKAKEHCSFAELLGEDKPYAEDAMMAQIPEVSLAPKVRPSASTSSLVLTCTHYRLDTVQLYSASFTHT